MEAGLATGAKCGEAALKKINHLPYFLRFLRSPINFFLTPQTLSSTLFKND
jgi:hypothetical protein